MKKQKLYFAKNQVRWLVVAAFTKRAATAEAKKELVKIAEIREANESEIAEYKKQFKEVLQAEGEE